MFSVLLRGDRACVLKRFGAAGCIAQGAWREAKNRKEGRGKRILNAKQGMQYFEGKKVRRSAVQMD